MDPKLVAEVVGEMQNKMEELQKLIEPDEEQKDLQQWVTKMQTMEGNLKKSIKDQTQKLEQLQEENAILIIFAILCAFMMGYFCLLNYLRRWSLNQRVQAVLQKVDGANNNNNQGGLPQPASLNQ